MTINNLMQSVFDSLRSNTTIDFYEESGIFKFEFHGEISPMNLIILNGYVPLISSHGYVCSICSFNSRVIFRVQKYE